MPQSPLANLLRQFAVKVEEKANDLAKGMAVAITDAVAEATPVDTGRARANWQVSVGSSKNDDIEPYFPGEHLGRGETQNLGATMEAARDAVAAYLGGPIFITNNVKDPKTKSSYIWALDQGSPQNPAGDFHGVADSAANAYWRTVK